MKAAEEEKEKALADQKAALQREREFAVAHAHSREQVQSARKLAELRRRYSLHFLLWSPNQAEHFIMVYLHCRTRTQLAIPMWRSVPKMGTLVIGDTSPDRDPIRVHVM